MSTSSECVLKSTDGLFELRLECGVGTKHTPWTGYTVVSFNDAYKFAVEVVLCPATATLEGSPIEIKYYDVYVSHGMYGRRDSLEDTRRFIEVLQSAIDFCLQIKNFGIIHPELDPCDTQDERVMHVAN